MWNVRAKGEGVCVGEGEGVCVGGGREEEIVCEGVCVCGGGRRCVGPSAMGQERLCRMKEGGAGDFNWENWRGFPIEISGRARRRERGREREREGRRGRDRKIGRERK